jgi:hypothetical protein
MAASSNPPPRSPSLRAPYASLPPRQNEHSSSSTTSQHPSHIQRTQPTWTDTTKARARMCKTHNLVRRPDGSCMACKREEREERAARSKSKLWLLAIAALAVCGVAAWFVLSGTAPSKPLASPLAAQSVKVSQSVPAPNAQSPAPRRPDVPPRQ